MRKWKTMITITLICIFVIAYSFYVPTDPNHENIVKNTVELKKAQYFEEIMSMGIDFPEDTRVIYENKDFTEGRFPELSFWAFFSKTRIHIPNETRDGKEDTMKNFDVFKKLVKKGNNSIKIESFKPDDNSFWSFWDIGAIECRGRVYTLNDASILQLRRIGKKDAVAQNPTDQESSPEADFLQKLEVVPSVDNL